MKKIDVTKLGLKIVALLAVLSVCFSIVTYGQTCIHSDTATATILSNSIVDNKSYFPATWNYVNGDIWVICNALFTLIPSQLMSNQSLARMIGSLVYVLLSMAGIIYQSRKMHKNNSWLISIPALFLCLFGMYDYILYQAAYTGVPLWMALNMTFINEIYQLPKGKLKNKYISIYFVLNILLVMGGTRFLAEMVIPEILAVALFLYIKAARENKVTKTLINKGVELGAVIMVPSIIGFGIYKWLCSWHNINSTSHNETVFVESFPQIADNFKIAIENLFVCFGYTGNAQLVSITGFRNLVSITLCIIMCFVVPYLQIRNYKNERDEVQLFCLFTLFHNLILIMVVVFFNETFSRYMLSSAMALVLMSSRYIYDNWIEQESFRKDVWRSLFIFAVLVECAGIIKQGVGYKATLAEEKAFNAELVNEGFSKGYATYWNAYTNEVYSDGKIRYAGVHITDGKVVPFRWLVDDSAFEPQDGISTFLALDDEELQQATNELEKQFGQPIDEFELNGFHIFVYDYDIATVL